MVTDENDLWLDSILNFFETKLPVKESSLRKARDYIKKKDSEIEKERNEEKKNKLKSSRDKKYQELLHLRKIAPEGEIKLWLKKTASKNIDKDKRIVKATHPFKFSHSSAPSDGILDETQANDCYLTTATLKNKRHVDLAHNNGNLISISNFLNLSNGKKTIFDMISEGNFSFLNSLFKDTDISDFYKQGFSNLIEDRSVKTVDKLKQIYFPRQTDDDYHLLTPLLSSSIAHKNYLSLSYSRFSNEQGIVRKSIKDQVPYFIGNIGVNYPKVAKILHGGDNKQNVSMHNQERSGFVDLFSTQPPIWQSQIKSPIYHGNWFYKGIPFYSVEEDISYLSDFLMRNENLKLSIKSPKKKSWLITWCNNILNTVFYHVQNIHNLPAGWSQVDDNKLSVSQQYFLDPYREDTDFQEAKITSDWQAEISHDFALWLNRQLIKKNDKFTPQTYHKKLWQALIGHKLRSHQDEVKKMMTTGGKS